MAVNATHAEYDASAGAWSRARDVISGEDAVKAAGERYLPRLESQSAEEYDAYCARAAFFNATARTADGFVGLMFRRAPFVRLPDANATAGKPLAQFSNDVDLLGTSLFGYAKNIATEVISVGRAGTLVDWESEGGPSGKAPTATPFPKKPASSRSGRKMARRSLGGSRDLAAATVLPRSPPAGFTA